METTMPSTSHDALHRESMRSTGSTTAREDSRRSNRAALPDDGCLPPVEAKANRGKLPDVPSTEGHSQRMNPHPARCDCKVCSTRKQHRKLCDKLRSIKASQQRHPNGGWSRADSGSSGAASGRESPDSGTEDETAPMWYKLRKKELKAAKQSVSSHSRFTSASTEDPLEAAKQMTSSNASKQKDTSAGSRLPSNSNVDRTASSKASKEKDTFAGSRLSSKSTVDRSVSSNTSKHNDRASKSFSNLTVTTEDPLEDLDTDRLRRERQISGSSTISTGSCNAPSKRVALLKSHRSLHEMEPEETTLEIATYRSEPYLDVGMLRKTMPIAPEGPPPQHRQFHRQRILSA
mmetsp:Transcript_54708/g.160915  ORF Transcript_54708/g.160915 Transcript_54708/m.160915 type:complete len:347 (+) Transcript_54708:113-1153(+)